MLQNLIYKTSKIIFLFWIIVILKVSYLYAINDKAIEKVDLDTPEDVAFFDEDGARRFLPEFEGKTILLVFWATWCPSCAQEIPILDNLQKDFRKLPFEVIAVSQDFQGIEIVKKFFRLNEIRYLKIFHDYRNNLFKAYSIVGLPTALLINQEGKTVLRFNGSIQWQDDSIRENILSYIPGSYAIPKNSYRPPSVHRILRSGVDEADRIKNEPTPSDTKILPNHITKQSNDS
jgi:thiol-disulfide isomerase/thioredoxin